AVRGSELFLVLAPGRRAPGDDLVALAAVVGVEGPAPPPALRAAHLAAAPPGGAALGHGPLRPPAYRGRRRASAGRRSPRPSARRPGWGARGRRAEGGSRVVAAGGLPDPPHRGVCSRNSRIPHIRPIRRVMTSRRPSPIAPPRWVSWCSMCSRSPASSTRK